jgi:hypothetical protein
MNAYAFAEIVAIINADAENGIATDIHKLANDLQLHLPSLSHNDIIELIVRCIDSVDGAAAWIQPDSLN